MNEAIEYTALLALPNGEMARDAAGRIFGAESVAITDNLEAGVWLSWSVFAVDDRSAIEQIQEIRLRAEMLPEYVAPNALTESGDHPSLFQATPLLILKGSAHVIHSEEVYCV